MSEAQQSRAAVIRVKGVSFNYLQFLWSGIGQIRQQQSLGNFSGSMALTTSFIPYLPDSMKDEFRKKANHINTVMNTIKSGSIPAIQRIPDFFMRGIYKNRLLQIYSNEVLTKFIDDMTTQLNKLGYMENLKMIAEGTADEGMDWIEIDRRRKRQAKMRKKKKEEPVGSME